MPEKIYSKSDSYRENVINAGTLEELFSALEILIYMSATNPESSLDGTGIDTSHPRLLNRIFNNVGQRNLHVAGTLMSCKSGAAYRPTISLSLRLITQLCELAISQYEGKEVRPGAEQQYQRMLDGIRQMSL